MDPRFATSPPTDNCPQPWQGALQNKLSLIFDNILTPRLCDLMVRRWSLTAHFLILYNPGGVVWVPDERAAHQGEPLARQGGARRTGRRSYCTPSETPIDFKEPIVRPLKTPTEC